MSLTILLMTLLCCAILTGMSIFSFINKPRFVKLVITAVLGFVSYVLLHVTAGAI
ncbi:hypothetical protein [Vibrio phage XZ1]|nr:hypothetical protein vBValMR10Z_2 [Vibrio phage vB_ValM_R10Z]QNJ54928.1 hypothetical protein vBValMR11Z_2 [Vibrio phage vB_ValM_R11Z]UOL51356.1 hypothetical protein [Vibrio phage XZ1]